MLFDLRDAVAQALASAGFQVKTDVSLTAKDKLTYVLVGPDVVELAPYGVSPVKRVRRETRRVTVMVWDKDPTKLDSKVEKIVEVITGLELQKRWSLILTVEPFYEPETRLYGAEVRVVAESRSVLP